MRTWMMVFFAVCLALTQAEARGRGTSGANYLKMGWGARPAGMGGAFCALADDINSLEWNPAGLARMVPDYLDAAFEHVFWFGDVEYEILSYAQNLGNLSGGGLQVLYRHMPDIDNDLVEELPEKVFDAAVTLGYGMRLVDFAMGANLKVLVSQMAGNRVVGQAIDLGVQTDFFEGRLLGGLAVQNLGPAMGPDPLPIVIRAGAGYTDFVSADRNHLVNASAELKQPIDNALQLMLGIEYWYQKTFAARCGYVQQIGSNDLQSDSLLQRMTLGTGIRWADLQLDYAFVPYADLGGTHRLTLKVHYGPLTDLIGR